MSGSKFSGIFQAKREQGAEPTPAINPAGESTDPTHPLPSPAPVEPPRRGRPPGKRSDPGFVQVTAYIPAEMHHKVKLALLMERQGREFSELVGELLADWLKSHP